MATPLALAQPDLTGNERKYLLEAFDSGYLTHAGTWEERFEREFGNWIGRPSIATSSGTGALHCALLSLGVGAGDQVIVPALTFSATASVVVQCGAVPVFVDIRPDNFGINWEHSRRAVTRRTKAVISVHLYGEDAGFEDVGVPVIEDACEALGMVPPRGHLTAYSFYGNKVITTGEGGMLCGNLGRARAFRDGGFTRDYDSVVAGLNYRITNLQAAIGCAQLERIDELVEKRLANAKTYADTIPGKGKWLYVADVQNPTALARALAKEGIDTRPVFRPLHLTQAFRQPRKFKHAERVWERGLCLPTGPHVTPEAQKRVIEIVLRHIRESSDQPSEHAA